METYIIRRSIIILGFIATIIFSITAVMMVRNDNENSIQFLIMGTLLGVFTELRIIRLDKQKQEKTIKLKQKKSLIQI
jgi:hypothetical protein